MLNYISSKIFYTCETYNFAYVSKENKRQKRYNICKLVSFSFIDNLSRLNRKLKQLKFSMNADNIFWCFMIDFTQ